MAKKKASARTRSNKRSQAEKYKEWSRSQPNVCIITRGSVSDQIRRLEDDLRTVFQPLTFVNSAKFSGAKMKELARTLPALKASHLLAITESECHVTLRMAKVPAGPTLTFRIPQWALRSDVACLGLSAAGDMPKSFFASSHPFLITSNFDADVPHEKILSVTLQNLFPNFDIEESDLKAFKRCAIFHRDAETGDIEFRHYAIKRTEQSSSDSISQIASSKLVKMANVDDVSDFVLKSVEDTTGSKDETIETGSEVPGKQKFSITLHEVGPRLKLDLLKVEEDFFGGKVLYHKLISKSPQEISQLEAQTRAKAKLKEQRVEQQNQAVARKTEQKASKRKRLLYRPAKDSSSRPQRNPAIKTSGKKYVNERQAE